MATQRYSGNAAAVAQVNTLTPGGTIVSGSTFTVTINGKAINYTTTVGTAADVVSGLTALLTASQFPEFAQLSWKASGTSAITATARVAGTPFTQTSSASGGGSPTFITATTTANSSPNDWANPLNWLSGSVPVNNDDVYLDLANVPILYGLNQVGVTLNSLNIPASFTQALGLQQFNPLGYVEYRPLYLAIGVTTINVGYGSGSGSGLIRIDTGSILASVNVSNTATSTEPNSYALQLKGLGNGQVTVNKGSVGIAKNAGETATLSILFVNYVSNQAGDATVFCGAGASIGTTLEQNGGSLTTNANIAAAINHTAGTHTVLAGNLSGSSVKILGGTLFYNGTGTISNIYVDGPGILSFVQDPRTRTVTNCTVYAGAQILDPLGSVTWVMGILFSQCNLQQVTCNFGNNLLLQVP